MQSNELPVQHSGSSKPKRLLVVVALLGLSGLIDLAFGHVTATLVFIVLAGAVFAVRRQVHGRSHVPTVVTAECAQCHRIKLSDEGWVTNGGYIEGQVRSERPAQKACPNCARRAYALAGYRDQPPSSS